MISLTYMASNLVCSCRLLREISHDFPKGEDIAVGENGGVKE